MLREVALEDRFDHVHHRRLNHPVPHRGDAQRPGLRRSRLGDVHASNGLGLVRSAAELVRQFPDSPGTVVEIRDRHVVHSRGTVDSRHLLERRPQIPLRKHFVKQPKPFPSFHSLFQSRQHADGPGTRFDPSPAREGLSGLLSQRHCRRCCLPWAWSSDIHLPGALRSPGVTRLRRYYGSSDSWAAGSSGPYEGP